MSISAKSRNINATAVAELKLTVPQKFEVHLLDTENPHNVTAEQIGAYTKTEMDNKLAECVKLTDIYVDAENYLCINTERTSDGQD